LKKTIRMLQVYADSVILKRKTPHAAIGVGGRDMDHGSIILGLKFQCIGDKILKHLLQLNGIRQNLGQGIMRDHRAGFVYRRL
jgi:hypothetical protein